MNDRPETEVLRERRREWWSQMWAVAAGVFLGQATFATAIYLLFENWVTSL